MWPFTNRWKEIVADQGLTIVELREQLDATRKDRDKLAKKADYQQDTIELWISKSNVFEQRTYELLSEVNTLRAELGAEKWREENSEDVFQRWAQQARVDVFDTRGVETFKLDCGGWAAENHGITKHPAMSAPENLIKSLESKGIVFEALE